MTESEVRDLLGIIKGFHQRFEVTEQVLIAWDFVFQDMPGDLVFKAVREVLLTEKFVENISSAIAAKVEEMQGGRGSLEWTAEELADFIQRKAWVRDVEKVLAECPPNVAAFIRSQGWRKLTQHMQSYTMTKELDARMKTFRPVNYTREALPPRTQKALSAAIKIQDTTPEKKTLVESVHKPTPKPRSSKRHTAEELKQQAAALLY